jgi:ferredoxin
MIMGIADGPVYCVIGSGPAGISAAMALVTRGVRVQLLDAGISLEPERQDVVTRLGATAPSQWQPADVARLRDGSQVTKGGIPLKRAFGSTYPFDMYGDTFRVELHGADLKPSFARGGLSTVWGAGMLPFHRDDIADWPFPAEELDPHYRAVLSFVPLTGARDSLESDFPLHCERVGDLQPSRQGQAFLADAHRAERRLTRAGITIGRSRLAVRAAPCTYCGMCLYGCPYDLIYSAASTLRDLQAHANFEYVSDFVVEELREEGGMVRIGGIDRRTGTRRETTAHRVFVGAGVIPSAALLLRSTGQYGTPITVRDSPYFLMPLVRMRGVPDLANEAKHTMAQAYILIRDAAISPSFVHLSVYTHNDLMEEALRLAGGPFGKVAPPFWRALAARMLVCGGYLHSRHSPGFTLQVDKDGTNGVVVRLESSDGGAEVRVLAARVGRKLMREAVALKAMAMTPLIQHSKPGRGFHAGASFPMRRERAPHSSDLLARPYGFERVHLVDASALPSIPATTVTFAVMAHAHRVATLASAHDLG